MLKGQDVILMILLRLRDKSEWTYGALSNALGISASQCHLAVHRLQKVKILSKHSDRLWHVNVSSFNEYVIHALKFDFPGEIGPVTRGIPTIHSGYLVSQSFFRNKPPANDLGEYVWPSPDGTMRGNSLEPIHSCQIHLIRHREHPDLQLNGDIYEFLVYADLIRAGRARERKWAIDRILGWK